MRSSYIQNNYGEVFRAIVDAFQPYLCVELGILDGYSSFHIATALKKLGRGELHSYDLFDDYAYKHGTIEEVRKVVVDLPCTVIKMDAYKVHEQYQSNAISLLHVDISNTGETVKRIMELWDEKMVHGGIILFEGGTEEGDQVEWRVKYNAPSIKREIETNKIIEEKYVFGTYLKWPGLTMLLKKR